MDELTETTISVTTYPPQEVSDFIMDIKKSTGVYYPDHEESLPHSTLYFCKFDESKYQTLMDDLQQIEVPAFEATIGELQFEEQPLKNNVFVSFNFKDPEKFADLHNKILAIANPLRGDLVRFKDIERYKNGKMSEEAWEGTQKNGFQYFRDKYYPHITVGSIEVNDQEKVQILKSKLKELEGKSFFVDKILLRLKRRTLPDEKVIFESEITEIALK